MDSLCVSNALPTLCGLGPGAEAAVELAAAIGRPHAVRAVGTAIGRNPISILIPCHRVLGALGQLTGYAGGVWRKQALLKLENVHFLTEEIQRP